jgi:membrane-associated phospholipid phosphatase
VTPLPEALQHADEQAFLALHQLLQRMISHDLMHFVGQLGNAISLSLLVVGLLALEPDGGRAMRRFALAGLAVLLAGGGTQLGKHLLPRHRPATALAAEFERGEASIEFDDARLAGSFPSGHAGTAFAMATVLLGWARALRPAWRRRLVRASIASLAVLVALQRVYAGAHFPLDVLAGAVVGVLSALLVRTFLGRLLEPEAARTSG